jgi:copper resistance protein B
LRHDFSADFTSQSLNYLTIGLEGLAPYLFETNAKIFISEKGNYSARLRQEVDILITQKLIMQPYFEAEFFAQDVERIKVRSGLAEIEAGILTRYEITRKFAPYFALRYHAKTFGTAHMNNDNERINDVIMSVGIRIRF